MKIGVLQFAPEFADISTNIAKIGQLLKNAPHADLWVLPELASTGYNFLNREQAVLLSEELSKSRFVNFLVGQAAKTNSWFVAGINERSGDKLYNSSVLVSPDGEAGVYRKLHLFRREKEFFEPGNLGLPVFESPWGKIGMLICFDWMFPEAWRILALKGVRLVCHPSNLVLPYCQGVVPGYALTNRMFIATVNRVGYERDIEFTGQSVVVDPFGEVLFYGNKKTQETVVVEIDTSLSDNKMITPENNLITDRRTDVYSLKVFSNCLIFILKTLLR